MAIIGSDDEWMNEWMHEWVNEWTHIACLWWYNKGYLLSIQSQTYALYLLVLCCAVYHTTFGPCSVENPQKKAILAVQQTWRNIFFSFLLENNTNTSYIVKVFFQNTHELSNLRALKMSCMHKIQCTSLNVWGRYFVWKFTGILWNILPNTNVYFNQGSVFKSC